VTQGTLEGIPQMACSLENSMKQAIKQLLVQLKKKMHCDQQNLQQHTIYNREFFESRGYPWTI